MEQLGGKTVLITGGASGIGRIMGRIVLSKGATLVIWDIDTRNLTAALNEFSPSGKVSGFRVDLSDPDSIRVVAAATLRRNPVIDVLVNNAGTVVGKYFHDHTDGKIERTMDVNAIAPMLVTREFLPGMLVRGSGHICNVASSAGLISNPRMSVYAASKWSVFGWSDSLRLEMRQLGKNIGVTTVTPYYISTGMFDGVRSLIPILKPEKVARHIVRGIERNRPVVSLPWSMRCVRLAQALLPIHLFDKVVGDVMGIYRTMEHFTGRKQ